MSSLLTIRALRKKIGPRTLLDIEELNIDVGTAYVLTGTNGSGKSTLLRILAGLLLPDTTEARFFGLPTTLYPYPKTMRDAIVYVHQHPVMFSTSLHHNIAYGLLVRGMPKPEIARRVEEAIAWAGIGHLRNTCPTSFSGGEKQRVALARARVLNPRLLLLDEPTANLDGQAKEQVIHLIPSLIQSGSSVVIACHDRDLIAVPGVRRLKLRDGHLELKTPLSAH